jgi:hypothetical protein
MSYPFNEILLFIKLMAISTVSEFGNNSDEIEYDKKLRI